MAIVVNGYRSRKDFSAHNPQCDRASLLKLAQQFGEEACHNNPYLRLLAVSGSLVRGGEDNHEDIDFFAVSAPGHIWDAFLLCLWQGRKFTRKNGLPRTFLCFNYLVDEHYPQEIDLTRSEHVRSFLNLVVVLGHESYRTLLVTLRSELESQEPALYKEALRRVESQISSSEGHSAAARNGRFWPFLFTSIMRLPFIIVVKRAETIRRGFYPGGLIYSNNRVIRSHLRLAWRENNSGVSCYSVGEAFSEVAPDYQRQVVSSSSNRHMRNIVHRVLVEIVQPGMKVLDLGAGTGEDAIWLAQHGAEVLAIDVAPGMVQVATRRVAEFGLDDRVRVRCLAIQNLRDLLPGEAGVFDIVLADFGVLNLAGRPETWAPVISRFLKPKGKLVASMINRWCLSEILAGLAGGKLHYAFRRIRGEPIRVGSHYLPVSLFTPGTFAKRLKAYFVQLDITGLCVTAMPPDLERVSNKVPKIENIARRLDQFAGRFWFLRNLGDHYLITFEKKSGAIIEFQIGARITSAPVVADLNRDNVPEIILAADKLYVINAYGQKLRGWPRRVGGAIASTATCFNKSNQTSIYVGSDNDYLNTFEIRGTRIKFSHFKTKGDVFSSPWVGDLLEDGSTCVVFGSDDGNVYALNSGGELLPGWPFTTRGYVSASPTVAQTCTGKKIILGSWDGQLYLLDCRGRLSPGWPQQLDFPIWGTAAVVDIDGCGGGEIIVASQKLFVFRGDGSLLENFPVNLHSYAVGSPALGDINGDGEAEIIVCADRIYGFDKNGRILPGFPFSTGAYIWSSPILFDLNGDGMQEIVVGDLNGRLWAIQGNGQVIKDFPQKLGSSFYAPATVADVDGDGFLELLTATGDGRFLILPTQCRDDHLSASWPQFRGGADGITFIKEGSNATVCENKIKQVVGTIKFDGNSPVINVELSPATPLPFKLTKVQVTLEDGFPLEGGILEYELDGKLHPSPLLKSNGVYFGLIQPLQLFKPVNFVFKLYVGDARCVRYPNSGFLQLRVGIKGIKHKTAEPRANSKSI